MGAETVKQPRKGILARIRSRGKKDSRPNAAARTATSSPVLVRKEEAAKMVVDDITPPSTPEARPSHAGVMLSVTSKLPIRGKVTLDQAPSARDSAFGGPPRYDWIDIVSAAFD
jgi:hypothetical protein